VITIEERLEVGLSGDRSLWESVQTIFLDVFLAQESRLDASVVVRIGTDEETYPRASD
jgi:hypothetical protein